MVCKNEMLLKNEVMCDYLSALIDRSKNLRRNTDTYNDKLKSINSKLSTATHTSNFI